MISSTGNGWTRLLLLVVAVAMASLSSAATNRIATTQTSVWIASEWGNHYDLESVLRQYPNLRRLYIPLFQLAPSLSANPLSVPEEYLANEAASYERLHARGVEVYGVFAPLHLDSASQAVVKPDWCEQPLQLAFEKPKATQWLSLYNPQAGDFWSSMLSSCLAKAKVDGVVLDMNYPANVFFGYSIQAREDCIKKFGIDPVDIDYLLGPPFAGKLKDDAATKLIAEDRLSRMRESIDRLANICHQAGKPFGLVGQLNIYEYATTTQAAAFGDWGSVLHEHPDALAVLAMVDGDAMTKSALLGFMKSVERFNVDLGRLSLLTDDSRKDQKAIGDFQSSRGAAIPPLNLTLLLRKP